VGIITPLSYGILTGRYFQLIEIVDIIINN